MKIFNKSWKLMVILAFGINFSLFVYAILLAKRQNRVYTIGVNRLTDSFTKELNNAKLSPNEQSRLLIDFANGLDSSLAEFKLKGRVLMMEEAVLSGGVDITEQVVANIKHKIENHDK